MTFDMIIDCLVVTFLKTIFPLKMTSSEYRGLS